LSYDTTTQILIYKCAIQLAIIGYGNKNYGFLKSNKNETIKLVDIFKMHNIKYDEKINSKFDDSDLSVRRLLRLFRYQIQKFIIGTQRPSYLWLKYSDKNKNYMNICFPGGEHVIERTDEAEFLLTTYGNLDNLRGTKFKERLIRVFIARSIFSPEYFKNKNM